MTEEQQIAELRKLLERAPKRARQLVEHILQYGQVTTEELQNVYGYEHPPRAARDVSELGIPLKRSWGRDSQGRRIRVYQLGDLSQMRRLSGRTPVPRRIKEAIVQKQGETCSICQLAMPARALQVDHRIPYGISGEVEEPQEHLDEFMLLCGSCNRAKSWSCEHCPNWVEEHLPDVCRKCYWAYPEDYKHIALRQIRRLDIVWSEEEIAVFERLQQKAQQLGKEVPEYVKAVLRQHVEEP
jgi:hypothetical protein